MGPLAANQFIVSSEPRRFSANKVSSEGLAKGDLLSGPAGPAEAELAIEQLVRGREEDG